MSCILRGFIIFACIHADLRVFAYKHVDLSVFACKHVDLIVFACKHVDLRVFACKHVDLSFFGQSIFLYESVVVHNICVLQSVTSGTGFCNNMFGTISQILEQYVCLQTVISISGTWFWNNLLVLTAANSNTYYEQYVLHTLCSVSNRYQYVT